MARTRDVQAVLQEMNSQHPEYTAELILELRQEISNQEDHIIELEREVDRLELQAKEEYPND